MSQIRLYLDEDAMGHDLRRALQTRGIDILTAAGAGRLGCSDEEQLRFAAHEGRTIYSFNVQDFSALHAQWIAEALPHAGIAVAPQTRYSVGDQLRRLLHIISRLSAEQMKNRLEYLNSWH